MKKFFSIVAMLLVLVTMFPMTAMACESDPAWINNILTNDPLEVFGLDKDEIISVTFLDSLWGAPKRTWHIGKGASKRVQAWVEWEGSYANIYIAAEGGVNAKNVCENMFNGYTELVEINFNGAFHTDYVTSMEGMFQDCTSLKSLDLSGFNTSNVTTMCNMFYGCEALEDVDLSSFDTSSVKSMYQMFRDCKSLEELDVSSFDTSSVTTMYAMFSTCVSLRELDLSSFDTSRVSNMGYMFSACRNLEKVNTSSFNTSRVTNMEGMFRWCDVLRCLNLKGWNVNRVKNYANFMNEGVYIDGCPWEYFFD